MAIPFPTLHIAESALNRVLNALEDNQTGVGIPIMPPITPPEPTAQSLELNDKLSQEPAPIEVPPENSEIANDSMLASSLTGGSPFDGALLGAL
jgi:hypothetical protein